MRCVMDVPNTTHTLFVSRSVLETGCFDETESLGKAESPVEHSLMRSGCSLISAGLGRTGVEGEKELSSCTTESFTLDDDVFIVSSDCCKFGGIKLLKDKLYRPCVILKSRFTL